ncbi:MAG: hypothetical protein JSW67_06150 [Candidatus Latescibacterota bacterium]|nr:MAG: hypothetical protein JSW67_06150 [Candidatus Latescibacterota bacterium]
MKPTDVRKEEPEVWTMVEAFLKWARATDYETYDWQDLWATRVAGRAKAFYQGHRALGALAVAPFAAVDMTYPGCRRFFAKRRKHPISLAHLGLGHVHLYRTLQEAQELDAAIRFGDLLLATATRTANGIGWGMKFRWHTIDGTIPEDTPCHTQTAYVYELLAALHAETSDSAYETPLRKIASHVCYDFPEWSFGEALASAYSTHDTRRVVNANSYRMMMLLDAGRRFGIQEYTDKGLATLEYVLSMQREDGSWPYSETEDFVDTFHTCFVLKNLVKAQRIFGNGIERAKQAVERGLAYYLSHLFDASGYPIPFSVRPRRTVYRYDSYDLAESIGILAELESESKRLRHLLRFVKTRLQTSDGWFRFRVYRRELGPGIPYMRWANSAMFVALTKFLQLRAHDGSA